MGVVKEAMLQAEDNRRWALEVLAEAEVLGVCEAHGEYYQGTEEVEEAYKLANRKITAGEGPFAPNERREATDAIKAAYEEHNFIADCPSCVRMMEKD